MAALKFWPLNEGKKDGSKVSINDSSPLGTESAASHNNHRRGPSPQGTVGVVP